MNNILILTDFSDTATNVARYAVTLSQQLGSCHFILYHSFQLIPIVTDVPIYTANIADMRAKTEMRLQDLISELRPLSVSGSTFEVLADENALRMSVPMVIRNKKVRLIVMGVTGASGMERALIGGNTINLVGEINSTMLLVPHGCIYEPIKRVVFATDLKVTAEDTVNEIKAIVKDLGVVLSILNVDYHHRDHYFPDVVKEQSSLHQLWDSENPDYYYTDHEDVAEGIMNFVQTNKMQLLIALPKTRGFFESIFHRSVTKRLAYHSRIPLLLFKH